MCFKTPDSDVRHPVAVVGLPGSGKTTVIAEFIKRLMAKGNSEKTDEAEKNLIVFFHVVASSPQSFSVKNMLTRLCEFLKKRCNLTLEVPNTMAALRDRYPSLLAPPTCPAFPFYLLLSLSVSSCFHVMLHIIMDNSGDLAHTQLDALCLNGSSNVQSRDNYRRDQPAVQ
jgi:hypothetical protein